MRNKFPGRCYRCGETVEAGAGHFEWLKGQRGWRVQHAECAIKYRGTDHHYQDHETPDPLDVYHPFCGISLGQD